MPKKPVRSSGSIDGNTIKVLYQDKEESVRLIGIDTPESRVNPRAKRESQRTGEDLKTILSMGKEATIRDVKSRKGYRSFG